jgi:6-phosphogluconate dehydrogenase
MTSQDCDLGLIGLGVMGRNFLLNLADHGFAVAGYDLDGDKVDQLQKEASAGHVIRPAADLGTFIGTLKTPRAVMLLVPAGNPVDAVIEALVPHLAPGDLIIDGGNSHFSDTDRRGPTLKDKGLLFMGTGISGGAYGARHGPSIMPGGPREGYDRVAALLTKAAADVAGEPCVAYLGGGSAGHYVKMVHNGIEYAFMELIAETYDFLKRGLGFSDEQLQGVFAEWNRGALESYLVEITARIFARSDERTGQPLIDEIKDVARQLGTGKWTSQDAMALQVPTPIIDAAVMMRNLSADTAPRQEASNVLSGPRPNLSGSAEHWIGIWGEALYAGLILAFAQGMELLQAASERYAYHLDLATVARIWRGGCIIRASLLESIGAVFRQEPGRRNLILDPKMAEALNRRQDALRQATAAAVQSGVPAPAYAAALAYFDAYRHTWLPENLVQAQRDFFGSHRYERVDAEGTFHTDWQKS